MKKILLLLLLMLTSLYQLCAQNEGYRYLLTYSSNCDLKRNGSVLDQINGIELLPDDTLCFFSNSLVEVERYHNGTYDSLLVFTGRYGSKRFSDICVKKTVVKTAWLKRTWDDVKSALLASSKLDGASVSSVNKNEGEDISVSSVPVKIGKVFNDSELDAFSDYIDTTLLQCVWVSDELMVRNMSEESCYFDIITVADGMCFSALSSDLTFMNEDHLEPGAAVACRIPAVFKGKDIFLVCSECPIPYNCVSLENVEIKAEDIDIRMLIKRVEK